MVCALIVLWVCVGAVRLSCGQAEAIYEDDEMAGGQGSQASIEPPKMPFRATFEKKGDDTK